MRRGLGCAARASGLTETTVTATFLWRTSSINFQQAYRGGTVWGRTLREWQWGRHHIRVDPAAALQGSQASAGYRTRLPYPWPDRETPEQ